MAAALGGSQVQGRRVVVVAQSQSVSASRPGPVAKTEHRPDQASEQARGGPGQHNILPLFSLGFTVNIILAHGCYCNKLCTNIKLFFVVKNPLKRLKR